MAKLIYRYGDPLHGDIRIIIKKTSAFLKGVGAGLIATGIVALMSMYAPILQHELNYLVKNNSYDSIDFSVQSAEAQTTAAIQQEAQSKGIGSYFSLHIPKIDASSDILANIDTTNQNEYESALKKGIAHAKGTYFPGMGNNTYLFSHSTDSLFNVTTFNAQFYLLNKLEKGDAIIVYFADKKYLYTVTEKHVVDARDTSWLAATDIETLTLQTCYPPGTTWKRLIVRAQ